jgi:hypothetical protein
LSRLTGRREPSRDDARMSTDPNNSDLAIAVDLALLLAKS